MFYTLLRIMLGLTALLMLAIWGVLALPYSDNQSQAFMSDAENCGGTCLMGIYPGSSTVAETLNHLRNHVWTTDVRLRASGVGYAQITWDWSGQQPALILSNHRGRITFYWDNEDSSGPELDDAVIETITIYTDIRIFSLQTYLGSADSGTANLRPDGNLGYTATYHVKDGVMILATEMVCPVNLMSYWNARTKLTFSVGRGSSQFVKPEDMVNIC